MARLKFDALAHYPFCTELQIYTSHINHGNHLDNAQLLTLVSEARLRFIRWLGYDEMDVLGLGTVVGDVGAQYLSEGFHGDVLRVELVPQDFNKYGFDLVFKMSQADSGLEVARGKCGIVFVHVDTKRPTPRPATFMSRLLAQAPGLTVA